MTKVFNLKIEKKEQSYIDVRGDYAVAVGTAALRQGWSKMARRTTVHKFVNQCCGLEHAAVINRQPVICLTASFLFQTV